MTILSPIFDGMIFTKNGKKANFYRSHILLWILFIIYESIITIVVTGKFWTPLDYFNAYFINILLFYVNAHLVLPFSHKKPIYITAALILLELFCFVIIKFSFSWTLFYFGIIAGDPFKSIHTAFSYTVWRFIYFMGLSTGYWFALNTIIERKKVSDLEKNKLLNQLQKEQLEKKLADSEIAYLKSQINPHFLFNTLNFLYNSALKTSAELSEPILLLSDIMRYALTDTSKNGKVDLQDEIEQINTFINLNQFRFDHNLQLAFTVSGNPAGKMILPLVLLTPIENIFKYGDLRNTDHPATIDLVIDEHHLHLKSNNRKLKSRRHIPSHGVGLKNLKLRLDAYYSQAHYIQVSENEDDYIFELQITL
jgi:two-component system LytT family sensor kinase